MRTMFDRKKFKALVHYVCWRCSDDPSKLGAVKLNKTLWLSDLAAYYRRGKPITGVGYVKRQFGPVPRAILPVLAELQEEGALTVDDARHYGRAKKKYTVHRPPPADFISDDERQIVDEMIQFVCDERTAAWISESSHDHVWQVAVDGEEIPHFTVFANPGEVTDDDLKWARLQVESELPSSPSE